MDRVKSHLRLQFAHSTRTISAEGCAGQTQIALSPAFRALDTNDLRRGLPRTGGSNRILAWRVVPDRDKSHSRLHFAHSTRTIPACVARDRDQSHSRLHFVRSTRTISPGLPATGTNRSLACISRIQHARSLLRTVTNRTLACISRVRHARSPQS